MKTSIKLGSSRLGGVEVVLQGIYDVRQDLEEGSCGLSDMRGATIA